MVCLPAPVRTGVGTRHQQRMLGHKSLYTTPEGHPSSCAAAAAALPVLLYARGTEAEREVWAEVFEVKVRRGLALSDHSDHLNRAINMTATAGAGREAVAVIAAAAEHTHWARGPGEAAELAEELLMGIHVPMGFNGGGAVTATEAAVTESNPSNEGEGEGEDEEGAMSRQLSLSLSVDSVATDASSSRCSSPAYE
jgi:hypothetical protein